jgi:hypothetical protein
VEAEPDDAVLYRISLSDDLESVDSVTPVGDTGIFVSEGGIAFGPDGTAYAVNAGATLGGLFTLNLQTGQATLVDLFEDRHDIAGLGWRDGMLVGLDSTENQLLLIDPTTAAVQTLADVEDPIGRVGGLTLPGEIGYFVTAGPDVLGDPGSNSLYAFSATTGEQELIGSFQGVIGGSGFSGLSIVPEPGALALLGVGGLSLLRRRRVA